jgi:hypothetical protein
MLIPQIVLGVVVLCLAGTFVWLTRKLVDTRIAWRHWTTPPRCMTVWGERRER